jgi:hypothetical protein
MERLSPLQHLSQGLISESDSLVFLRYRGENIRKIMVQPVMRSSSKPLKLPKRQTFKFISVTPSRFKTKPQRKKDSGFKDQNLQQVYETLTKDLKFDNFKCK